MLLKKFNSILGNMDTKIPRFWGYLFITLYDFRDTFLKIISGILGPPTSRASMITAYDIL